MSGRLQLPGRAQRPTMYFIGVTTQKSIIMRVFPRWARHLGLEPCRIRGIDLAIHDRPEAYREVLRFIKEDPLSLGALVTTHKIDLLAACRDMFDGLDRYAELLGEVSVISKKDGKLLGAAKDPITSGLALEAFIPRGHWERTGADCFIVGAGGSSIALSVYLAARERGADRPARIIVSNRSPGRLEETKGIHRKLGVDLPVLYVHTPRPEDNDAVLKDLRPHSLVANATGLGKDAPGSPVTGAALFPEGGYAWDFNYRGDLVFLTQARAQEKSRGLTVVDGWAYFIHGWTSGMAEVLHREIPAEGPAFAELSRLARICREKD
jgi:shikimate 5-dehydrogenase